MNWARNALLQIGQRPGHDLSGRRIVSAIDPDFRALRRKIMEPPWRQSLKARRPDSRRDAFCNGLLRNVKVFERPCGRNGRSCISELMTPEKPGQRQIQQAILVLEDEPAMLFEDVPSPSAHMQGR